MKLSAAMMVKNEEEMLPDCIESFKRLVDEIVIVDTGSNDRTVEIANEYGATVYHHPWQDDFSLHRNQSIEYCTGDWVLIIDADERLRHGNKTKDELKAAFRFLPDGAEVLAVTVININKDGTHGSQFLSPRWIRPHLRYKYAKHNELQFDSEAVGTDFVLEHYGYDKSIVSDKGKVARDIKMLRKDFKDAARIEADFKRYGELARLHHYMSNVFMMDNRWKLGIAHGIAAMKNLQKIVAGGVFVKDSTLQLFSKLYHTIAMAYYNTGDLNTAWYWADHGNIRYPDHPDFHADLVFIGKAGNNRDLVDQHRQAYFDSLKRLDEKPWELGCCTVFMGGKHNQEAVLNA